MDALEVPHVYRGARVAFLTQHGKERVIAPLFASRLGASVELAHGCDTDTLGTFTRETARAGSQLAAARRKADIAIERSGLELGLGSEGAFVPGPFGLGSWNVEVLVFLDRARAIEVVGRAHAAGLHVHGTVRSREELETLSTRAGFPAHGLVVRPNDEHDPRPIKGLRVPDALTAAFEEARRASRTGVVFIESDLRAHMHPNRMNTIAAAGEDLVSRLLSACPACGIPGFGFVTDVPGRPCAHCGAPTREPVARAFGCVRCAHRTESPIEARPLKASPSVCDFCNP